VSSLSKEQFLKINGFPNNYWGWGGEDDDIFNRFENPSKGISHPIMTVLSFFFYLTLILFQTHLLIVTHTKKHF